MSFLFISKKDGDPVKLFDVKGIDISEEIDQKNKTSLSLHLVSLLGNYCSLQNRIDLRNS